jgi:predicted TIM-barrel fold metal-dependent hydrolase
MVIDFRVRPPVGSFRNLSIAQSKSGRKEVFGAWAGDPAPSHTEGSMELFKEELREAEVKHCVIWGRAVPNAAQSTPNEEVADVVKSDPELFSGFAGIKIPGAGELEATLKEVDRGINDLGLRGITVEPGFAFSATDGPDDPRLYPIYERCQELGGILAFTLSVRAGPNIRYSHPSAVDRVAADFPKLRIVVGHACWPWVTEVCGVAYRNKNIYLLPDFYGVHFPGYTHWVEAANSFLSDRIIFGSGYPIMDVRVLLNEYKKLGYNEGVLEKVLYKNAARLLGLDHVTVS